MSLDLPRAPFKVEFAILFMHNLVITICGGRTITSYVMNNCYSLNLKEGTDHEYLIWKSRSSMITSVLYSAGEKIKLQNQPKFWLVGGELTTASRIQLAGPTTETSLYDIESDTWSEFIDLPLALAGHCVFAIRQNKIVIAGGYKDNGLPNMNGLTIDFNLGGPEKVRDASTIMVFSTI